MRLSFSQWQELSGDTQYAGVHWTIEATWQILPPDIFLQAVLEDLTKGHLVNV